VDRLPHETFRRQLKRNTIWERGVPVLAFPFCIERVFLVRVTTHPPHGSDKSDAWLGFVFRRRGGALQALAYAALLKQLRLQRKQWTMFDM
jgi:hypothetical protein